MRRTINNCQIVYDADKIIGVNLGYDFCAEHEWGFKWAESGLGRPSAPTRALYGVESRQTTKHDMLIELVEHKDELWLRAIPKPFFRAEEDKLADHLNSANQAYYIKEIGRQPSVRRAKDDLRAAWSAEGGFCVVGQTDKGKEAVRLIHDALLDDRCVIAIAGTSNPFCRGGLTLLAADLISADTRKEVVAADLDRLDLLEAAAATGIAERLEKAGKRYYALSPQWDNRGKAGKSKNNNRKVMFYLNPMDQQANNSGWYDVATLDQWIKGEGPIPKTAEQRKAR